MKPLSCDILVVGAGPAGSSAARVAAEQNMKVILVERRPVIGVPVRCAEYIPAPLVGELNLGKSYVVQALQGMQTTLPNGAVKKMRAPGYTVHRDRFDQILAKAAAKAGARILLGTKAISRDQTLVHLKNETGASLSIAANVIIGADGPHTTVGKWIGSVNKNLIPAVQVTVPLPKPMDHTEIYFDPEIYGGYGWLFPKGDQANVGLGIKRRKQTKLHAKGAKKIGQVLNRLVHTLASDGKIHPNPIRYVAGWIPAEPLRKVTGENILLVGDAAGHTHPITGAGVYQAVVCGQMAGKWAARSVHEKDFQLLQEYEAEWRELFGQTLQRAHHRRCLLEQNWNHLNEVIRRCWVAFKEYYAEST